MAFTDTGSGLSVLIVCDYVPHHDWMAFASWYSLNKMLPDATVKIICGRNTPKKAQYGWTRACRVGFHLRNSVPEEDMIWDSYKCGFVDAPFLVLRPDIVMIRPLDESWTGRGNGKSEKMWLVTDPNGELPAANFYTDANGEELSSFVSYGDGWGKFVTAEWINRLGSPFPRRFETASMTPNEVRIDKLWKQLMPLYQTLSRG